MAFTGHDHVVVAAQPQLGRPAGERRGEGGQRGDAGGLGLLAAEGAAHAAHFHQHVVDFDPEDVRHPVLHLGRVLGGGVDGDVPVLAGDRQGDLGFEIEMVLPAARYLAGHPAGGRLDRALGVSPDDAVGRIGELPFFQRRVDGEDRLQHLVTDIDQPGGLAAQIVGVGGDDEDRLAGILGEALGENGLVGEDGRDIVLSRNVAGPEDAGHPRRPERVRDIHRDDPRMGVGADHREDLQRAGQRRHVVHIDRIAGDVLDRAVVPEPRMGRADDIALGGFRAAHRISATSRGSSTPETSRHSRANRFLATMDR